MKNGCSCCGASSGCPCSWCADCGNCYYHAPGCSCQIDTDEDAEDEDEGDDED